MSILNPLLQRFMKPDKKEAPVDNANSETKDANEISQPVIEAPKEEMKNHPKPEQTKKKGKSNPKKPKKVVQDHPKIPEAAPQTTDQPPAVLDFKYLKAENISINENYKASPDWERNLILWFARLRPSIWKFENNGSSNIQNVINLIEADQMPQTDIVSNLYESERILFYFARKPNFFTKSNLAWIFSALLYLNRCINGEIVECLTYLLTKMIQQINSLPSVEHPLYPYLMTVATILQKFYHVT